jgi:calcium-independent phospholipase A2
MRRLFPPTFKLITYFYGFRAFGHFLDGGLIANNPTLDALSEIHEHHLALKAVGREDEAAPVSVVVSLGTGVIPVTPVREIDVFLPGSILDSVKLYTGISTLGTLLVDQATASDGRVVDRARAWCSTIGVPYFRFSPQMSEEIAMNETSDEKLCKMLWETKAYMYKNHQTIKQMADILNRN